MSSISIKALSSNMQIALVPTVGVIHPGVLGMVRSARKMADLVVISIFVDRNLFLSEEEYEAFPRDLTRDIDLLRDESVDYVFAPAPEEMYPPGFSTFVEVENFGDKLPGLRRSPLFKGMPTTALKLIHIVRPSFLFLAQKDGLEATILRKTLRDFNLSTEVVIAPAVRDPSGLAYAARTHFLSETQRGAAAVVYRSLQTASEAISKGENQAKKIVAHMTEVLQPAPELEIEHIVIADPESLEPVSKIRDAVLISIGVKIAGTYVSDSLITKAPTS